MTPGQSRCESRLLKLPSGAAARREAVPCRHEQGGSMPKMLTSAQVDQFWEQGFVAPIGVLSAAEARDCRDQLERFETTAGGPLRGDLRHKSHLLFTWLADLVRHPRILDAVEDVIGPNILCWGSSFFIKEPRNPGFVSWHQDSTYWGLDPADVITAWIAFSDSTPANGAMR